jgi:hypothetical protein
MTEATQNAWPPEIEIEEEQPDRVRYRLPARQWGRIGFRAWILLITVAAVLLWTFAEQVPIGRPGQAWHPFGFMFSLFLVLAFSYPIYHLLLYLVCHCEIELRDGQLFATERSALLRRSRRWPLARLKRLQVMGLLGPARDPSALRSQAEAIVAQLQTSRSRRRLGTEEPVNGADDSGADRSAAAKKKSPPANFNALTGVLDDNRRFIIAAGYPREWLLRLADDISARCNVAVESSNVPKLETSPPVLGLQSIVAQAKEDARLATEPDVFEQPAGSDVQVDSFDGGVTLRVPPRGLRKGSAGLFQFSIVWLVMVGGFTTIFVVAGLGQGGLGAMFGALAFMSLFWLAGAGMFLAGWNMGRRDAAVAVVDGKLLVMQTGLRRAKRQEWPVNEIKTVCVGPSGMEMNDVPVPELQIHGQKNKLFGLLAGRDERELAWMATVLRQAIKREPAGDASDSTAMSEPL